MNIDKLLSGIGIVIDDKIYEADDDGIMELIGQIKEKYIPIITYKEIPYDKDIENFRNISFILLDWNLDNSGMESMKLLGVKSGNTIMERNNQRNVEFISKIKDICFTPIFIFSNANRADIEDTLKKTRLFKGDGSDFIFIESKSKLKSNLFQKIEKWIKDTPSIYALKEWEHSFYKAKNELFWYFYSINHNWPKILWDVYEGDETSKSNELGELITRNVVNRIKSFEFEKDILSTANLPEKKDIREVMEGERFIKDALLADNEIHTGDIYEISPNSGEYYLNIRPQCNLVLRNVNDDITSIDLYLISGKKLGEPTSKDKFEKFFKQERVTTAIVFPINDSIIEFKFKDLKIISLSDLGLPRFGRLLPPYITKIQQSYALYLQRQGLPPIPKEAIIDR